MNKREKTILKSIIADLILSRASFNTIERKDIMLKSAINELRELNGEKYEY